LGKIKIFNISRMITLDEYYNLVIISKWIVCDQNKRLITLTYENISCFLLRDARTNTDLACLVVI
jgi:hypothetical protein